MQREKIHERGKEEEGCPDKKIRRDIFPPDFRVFCKGRKRT